jgi:hypothetical protein
MGRHGLPRGVIRTTSPVVGACMTQLPPTYVVQVAEVERLVSGLQLGAGDGLRVLPLPLGVVPQRDPGSGPGVERQPGAVERPGAGRGPHVGLPMGSGGFGGDSVFAGTEHERTYDRPDRIACVAG